MKGRLGTIAVLVACAAALLGAEAPGAAAATELGNGCEANESVPGPDTAFEYLGFGVDGGAPTTGVITHWRLNVLGAPATETQRLKVVRELQEGFEVVGESAVETVAAADQGLATRVPVRRGDLLGSASQSGGSTYTCEGQSNEDALSIKEGDAPVGSTYGISIFEIGQALPLRVTIEPDADGDGYGDETQDGCSTDASKQGPCFLPPAPPVAPPLPTPHPLAVASAHKGSVTVKATTDVAGPVTVTGSAKLGKGKGAKLNGGTKTLAAGQQGSFTLKFTKRLKAKLATLPASRKLKLAITVTAANSAGAAGVQSLTVKLPGQG